MEFKRTTLANGLEVIAEINPAAWTAAIGFFVRTGSRDETAEVSGVSHFLEHMLFKGTPSRTAEEVNRQLDEMGGVSNACTGEEMTIYYAVVLPELQTRMVDLLTDMLRPSLRQCDFDTEKKVILEEIKMYEDLPPFGVDEKYRELFFAGHPLAKSVLGTSQTISALTVEQMRGYFDRRYASDNIVAAACGKVDFDKFVRDIEQRTADWRPSRPTRESFRPKGKRGRTVYHRPASQQEYIFQICDAPAACDDIRHEAAVLANIVGDDIGSRLFWELVDSGRADSASFSYSDYLDAGLFIASLCCAPEKAAENAAVMNRVLAEAQNSGITAEELERSKNKILSRLARAGERAGRRLFAVGAEWAQTGRYFSTEDDMNRIRSMSVEAVNSVLEQYPITDPLTVAIGPMKEGEF